MKVFGIGLNKTGTTTLGHALEILGFDHHVSCNGRLVKSWKNNDLSAIFETAELNNNFEDWPWPLVYQEMWEKYPDAKFIFTVRKSSEVWYKSLCKHAERTGPKKIRKRIYGYYMPHHYKTEHIDFYERHNRAGMEFFEKHASEKLKVICFEEGMGWKELCGYLEVPAPEVEFPFLNKASDKSNRIRKAKIAHNSAKKLVYNDYSLVRNLIPRVS